MKTNAIFLVMVAQAAACSSTPAPTEFNQNAAGTSAGGTSPLTAGGAGTGNVAGGMASAGSGGTPNTAAGSGGSAGTGGTLAGGSGGLSGSSGSLGGSSGTGGASAGGSGGSVPVGNLPNQVPPDYKGTPFGGTAQQIPGKIEVERYDLGGVGVAFNATAGGAFNACGFMRTDAIALECTGQPGPQDQDFATCLNYPAGSVYIGYIGGGNWYKYTVDVVQAGTYVISGHAGVAPNNTAVTFAFTADTKTGNIALPSTAGKCTSEAYHVWGESDNLGQIALVPGHYVLTITVVDAGMNLDWFAFTKL